MPSEMAVKDDQLGLRISGELKNALIDIAKREGRSLAQLCEIFLKAGVREYEKDGAKYVQRVLQSK